MASQDQDIPLEISNEVLEENSIPVQSAAPVQASSAEVQNTVSAQIQNEQEDLIEVLDITPEHIDLIEIPDDTPEQEVSIEVPDIASKLKDFIKILDSTPVRESSSKVQNTSEQQSTSEFSNGCIDPEINMFRVNSPFSVEDVFNGKSVFITGATGFLGKVLLEKLLRSCKDIASIYILVRIDDRKDADKRLETLLESKVFDRIRNECPKVLGKVKAVPGDIALPRLGLSNYHLGIVKSEVSFVFHCAATVRFDESPRKALSSNLMGVMRLLDVCRDMKILQAMVHVSTAYSFSNRTNIAEQLYPEEASATEMLKAVWEMSDEDLQELCDHHIAGRPSIYHFSKAMAEMLVVQYATCLPVVIVRPSIVTAAWKEPFPGWVDNPNGPSGLIAVCGMGIVRSLYLKPDVQADWVPVDVVVNTLIVAACTTALKKNAGKFEVPIINCTCPKSNILTWHDVVNICLPMLYLYPSMKVVRYPGGKVTSSYFWYRVRTFLCHTVPAYFIDGISFIIRRKRRMTRIYRRIHRVLDHLQYFTTHRFVFEDSNRCQLYDQIQDLDKMNFPIDMRQLSWDEYIENYVLGVRRYFLLEDDSTIREAIWKMKRTFYFWLAAEMGVLFGTFLLIRTCRRIKNFSFYLRVKPCHLV